MGIMVSGCILVFLTIEKANWQVFRTFVIDFKVGSVCCFACFLYVVVRRFCVPHQQLLFLLVGAVSGFAAFLVCFSEVHEATSPANHEIWL
jgi:hypothetical protein